jgi:diguanylate cyclase (GGDEF)-like protein
LFTLPIVAIAATRTLELKVEHQQRLAAANDQALSLARRGIELQQDLVSETRSLMQILSHVPDVTQGSPSQCHAVLVETVREKPWLKGLWVAGANGRASCSTVPGGLNLDFSRKTYFQSALETKRFVIEHYAVGSLKALPGAIAALPVVDADGQVRKIILGSLDLNWLTSVVDEVTRSAGASFSLIDDKGLVIARYPNIDNMIGQNVSNHPIVKAMGNSAQGQFEMPDLDGTVRIFGFGRLGSTDSRLVIGLSRDEVLSAINRQTRISIFNFIGVCLLGLLVAWFGGERLLVKPVKALAGAAARIGAGDYSDKISPKDYRSEFRVLATALHDMAERLDAREGMLRATVDRMTTLAELDPLTSLANRRRFDRSLRACWKDSNRHRHSLAVLLIDVDHFKLLNDEYGHVVGDHCLRQISNVLRTSSVLDEGLAARFGGEEFAVLLPMSDSNHARELAEHIRLEIESLNIMNVNAPTGSLTVSIGVAARSASDQVSATIMIQQADAALYQAKRGGRNRVVVAGEVPSENAEGNLSTHAAA